RLPATRRSPPTVVFACWRNEMKRGQPENPSTRQGCAIHENLGPKEATKERGPRISGGARPKRSEWLVGLEMARTLRRTAAKNRKRPDEVRANSRPHQRTPDTPW